MQRVDELFDISYGHGLELNAQIIDKNGINFVARGQKNNGVSAKIKLISTLQPKKAGTITVAVGGSVMEAFLQPAPYYAAYHILVLSSKIELTDQQKLYYCACLRSNKYRYNYGRQANKTLKDILIPSICKIPEWVNKADICQFEGAKTAMLDKSPIKLNVQEWKYFQYDDVFEIFKGFYNKKPPASNNMEIPFIGASQSNNGITSYHNLDDIEKTYAGNCITVANNGNSVASAFYQNKEFTCTHDVNILRLKNHKLNKNIAMFLCTLIYKEKYRWSYGRKWRPIRMPDSTIKLPVDKSGKPDWKFMEDYIKSLPYSSSL